MQKYSSTIIWTEIQYTYSIHNTMQQSPSSEGNSMLGSSYEIPRILWNLTLHYCVHKSPQHTCKRNAWCRQEKNELSA
jgi:hypothetical protein